MRCGTPAGYVDHRKRKEEPCAACKDARSDYDKRRLAASPEMVRRARLASKAQRMALSQLSKLHPDDYRALYVAAKAELEALAEGVTA